MVGTDTNADAAGYSPLRFPVPGTSESAYDRYGHPKHPDLKTCDGCHNIKENDLFPRSTFIHNICQECREQQKITCVNCNDPISFSSRFAYSTTAFDFGRFFLCSRCEGHELCLGCDTTFMICQMGRHDEECLRAYFKKLSFGWPILEENDFKLVFTNFEYIENDQYTSTDASTDPW